MMLKEFGLKPHEVDKLDVTFIDTLIILHETLKREEEWEMKKSRRR